MKTHIAFCPHFHQPHFQLYRTREEAFANSYLPWLEMLEKAAEKDGFYINLHFSGPFMAWLFRDKPWYFQRMKTVVDTGRAGLIGGFADEPFIQLSSRPDDVYYQMRAYEDLTEKLFGVSAGGWEGIHLVEREAGEFMLHRTAAAASILGCAPIVYLDAETYYESYYSYPGGQYDYCRKHFGFKDAYSKTTAAHLPKEMLYYAMRDEIAGQPFTVLPVHSEFRYRLLKRQPFGQMDKTVVSPKQYLFYIKDASEEAIRLAGELGKSIEPMVLIFEDAEKFGQWSKDPAGDSAWLEEFFRLVINDPDVCFTGLRQYVSSQGIFDTYPAVTSHSYPEWENWTAKRGIRGISLGDERLRRLISRQRDLENTLENLDRYILKIIASDLLPAALMQEALDSSPRKTEIVKTVLFNRYSEEHARMYEIIHRVRNLAYQEDPRWASRHPSYGSCAYFDVQGTGYLHLAERLLERLLAAVSGEHPAAAGLNSYDWDLDGREELVIRTENQLAVIDPDSGEVIFHSVLGAVPADINLLHLLEADMTVPTPYSTIQSKAYPLVLTETDSELCQVLDTEGGRVERCRNAYQMRIADQEGNTVVRLKDALHFSISDTAVEHDRVRVLLSGSCEFEYEGSIYAINVQKSFTAEQTNLAVHAGVTITPEPAAGLFFLVPEWVTTSAPSDEVDFAPVSWLGICGETKEIPMLISDLPGMRDDIRLVSARMPEKVTYAFSFHPGSGKPFQNAVNWHIQSTEPMHRMEIHPAVGSYYANHVFPDQSKLGYDSSGIRLEPYYPVAGGKASFTVMLDWALDTVCEKQSFDQVFDILGGKKE